MVAAHKAAKTMSQSIAPAPSRLEKVANAKRSSG
jgi:hypothetical protein